MRDEKFLNILIDFNFAGAKRLLRSSIFMPWCRCALSALFRTVEKPMTVSFPLTDGRNLDQLVKHLSAYNLSYPGNCALSVKTSIVVVVSQFAYALGTARTAW
jgi:hypothetical protein